MGFNNINYCILFFTYDHNTVFVGRGERGREREEEREKETKKS